ncbi:hypothetical protein PLICRDRAFT_34473 [Plicaturopsis crispa FD-325 SS-3]|nr:hypothetical protein PLICRDRAFT_34473 [Plicaturopsis crispa FD-325 SS-3]
MDNDATKTLALASKHLVGPRLSPSDIAWATDIPVGKALIEWLACQVAIYEPDASTSTRTSLEHISLEREELEILKRLQALGLVNDVPAARDDYTPVVPPAAYVLPSQLRSQAAYMDNESELLEAEVASLKHRLTVTRTIGQQTAQTVKALREAVADADSSIAANEERLGALSIRADTSIVNSTNAAAVLLGTVATKFTGEKNPKAMLSALSSARTQVIEHYQDSIHAATVACASLPSVDVVRCEGLRLADAIVASPQYRHLYNMSQRLDHGEPIRDILVNEDAETSHLSRDSVYELERAWSLDQAEVMSAQSHALDAAIATFRDTLLSPLKHLHDRLSARDAHDREAEALVGALLEEVGDVTDDVREARRYAEYFRAGNAGISENVVSDALKHVKDLRPTDAPPLILLDRADILAELRRVDRDRISAETEESWVKCLPHELSSLSHADSQLFSVVYEHSPLNTSPPFLPPPSAADGEAAANHIHHEIARLQKERADALSARTMRKLGAFVEKCGVR